MKASPLLLAALGLLLCAPLIGCPEEAKNEEAAAGDLPFAKGDEDKRLSVKIAALISLRDELETLRKELGADAKRADSLNVLYLTLRNRVGAERTDEIVAAVRASRAAERQQPQGERAPAGAPMNRQERLTRLADTAGTLMLPEFPTEQDSDIVAVLKKRLAAEQEATLPVLSAAGLARKALDHVGELEQVVGELAKIAEAEGIPVKALPKKAIAKKATDAGQ